MDPIRLLIVDDEKPVRDIIRWPFEKAGGFSIYEAPNGEEALCVAEQTKPHIALVDLKMPGMDGYTLCEIIRNQYPATGLIVVTAYSEHANAVRCLEAVADDFIAKPFDDDVLLARVKAVLRRITPDCTESNSDIIRLSGLEIRPAAREVLKNGKPVDLTAREFALLHYLAKQPNVAFRREQILDEVWGSDRFREPKVVDIFISHLRDKLGEDPSNPRIILTIRGYGYKLANPTGREPPAGGPG